MNVIKFNTGRVTGYFLEGSLNSTLFDETNHYILDIKLNISINNINIINENEQIFNLSKVKSIKDLTERDCSEIFLEQYPSIKSMESPIELKYKFGEYSYAYALDCFKDLLAKHNLKITDNYLIIT